MRVNAFDDLNDCVDIAQVKKFPSEDQDQSYTYGFYLSAMRLVSYLAAMTLVSAGRRHVDDHQRQSARPAAESKTLQMGQNELHLYGYQIDQIGTSYQMWQGVGTRLA